MAAGGGGGGIILGGWARANLSSANSVIISFPLFIIKVIFLHLEFMSHLFTLLSNILFGSDFDQEGGLSPIEHPKSP
jgi:hypothetical protein